MNTNITFIGQFPPPMHGLSKAVETLYNSSLKNKYAFKAINITNNKIFILNLFKILLSPRQDLYYFTISQTKGGNLRDIIILKLLQWKGSKCIIHLHGGYYRTLIDSDCGKLQRKLNYKVLNHIAGAIVLGNSLRNIFKGLISEDKIFVVPNCVDKQFILSNQEFQRKYDTLCNQSVIQVLYLSNFIETKGYKEVLKLAKKVQTQQNQFFHFHFAGKFYKEEDKNYFYNYINDNKLNNIVSYHGIVLGDKKKDLLKSCNIFILLTRYPNEGQPISILEAMGNAMGIITTNHAGIPDITKDKLNGLVVDKNNINLNEIYDYIQYLNQNRNVLKGIASTNYQTAITQYTEAQYISNLDKVFQTVLNK